MEVTLEALQKAWRQATESEKKMLNNLYGEDKCQPKDITERVKSYEDAMKENGKTPKTVDSYDGDEGEFAFHQLKEIYIALNEGHVFDWQNPNERKWNVVMNMSAAGGPAFCDSDAWATDSGCGSRLSLKEKRLSDYVGRQFLPILIKFYSQNQ